MNTVYENLQRLVTEKKMACYLQMTFGGIKKKKFSCNIGPLKKPTNMVTGRIDVFPTLERKRRRENFIQLIEVID